MKSIKNFLFFDNKAAWFWLVVRVYLGYEWLIAGYEKIINPAWAGNSAGGAIVGFTNGALSKTSGMHPDVSSWYAWFLKSFVLTHPSFWSHLIAYGEFLVGIGLILGAFTFVASFFGFFMNLNYLLAGTVSTNPQMLILALLLMLSHKIAGVIGIDRYLHNIRKWALFRSS